MWRSIILSTFNIEHSRRLLLSMYDTTAQSQSYNNKSTLYAPVKNAHRSMYDMLSPVSPPHGQPSKAKRQEKRTKRRTLSSSRHVYTLYSLVAPDSSRSSVSFHRRCPRKSIPPTTPAARARPPTIATPISPSRDTLSSIKVRRLAACRFPGSLSTRRSL